VPDDGEEVLNPIRIAISAISRISFLELEELERRVEMNPVERNPNTVPKEDFEHFV
jgi:hypothetical protein